jgi:hypothetical protein
MASAARPATVPGAVRWGRPCRVDVTGFAPDGGCGETSVLPGVAQLAAFDSCGQVLDLNGGRVKTERSTSGSRDREAALLEVRALPSRPHAL